MFATHVDMALPGTDLLEQIDDNVFAYFDQEDSTELLTMRAKPSPSRPRIGKCVTFLDLPAELRLQVYSYLLPDLSLTAAGYSGPGPFRTPYSIAAQPRPSHSYSCTDVANYVYSLRRDRARCSTTFMALCRQVHAEAAHLLYDKHELEVASDLRACSTGYGGQLMFCDKKVWLPPHPKIGPRIANVPGRWLRKVHLSIIVHAWTSGDRYGTDMPREVPLLRNVLHGIGFLSEMVGQMGLLEALTIAYDVIGVHKLPAAALEANLMKLMEPWRRLETPNKTATVSFKIMKTTAAYSQIEGDVWEEHKPSERLRQYLQGLAGAIMRPGMAGLDKIRQRLVGPERGRKWYSPEVGLPVPSKVMVLWPRRIRRTKP